MWQNNLQLFLLYELILQNHLLLIIILHYVISIIIKAHSMTMAPVSNITILSPISILGKARSIANLSLFSQENQLHHKYGRKEHFLFPLLPYDDMNHKELVALNWPYKNPNLHNFYMYAFDVIQ